VHEFLGPIEDITVSLLKADQAFDALHLSFTSRIHQDYEIQVEVVASDTPHNAFTNERCFVVGAWYAVIVRFARQHNKLMYLQGVCTELIATGRYANEQEIQKLTLRSELFPLFTNRRSGIYYGGNLHDVIDKVLIALTQQFHYNEHTAFEKKLTADAAIWRLV
jgi:hypothetical protein